MLTLKMYNLRSSKPKKNISTTNCYLQQYLKHSSPETFNPQVHLERIKLLDCRNENSRFFVKEGRIVMKEQIHTGQGSGKSNKSHFWEFSCSVILIALCVFYFKGEMQSYGVVIARKFESIGPVIRNHFLESVKAHENYVKSFLYNEKGIKKKNARQKFTVKEQHSSSKPKRDEIDIMKIVEEELMDFTCRNKFRDLTNFSKSFVEQQCETDVKSNLITVFEESNLTDYALESQGAEILTVFDTEPYGTKTLKFLNFQIWPWLGHFLMKQMKYSSTNEVNSILKPWKQAGDCWAFKGSQGRVLIKLSEKIFITAITIDHIPKEFTLDGNTDSAPEKFSLLGILEPGTQVDGQNLGTFKYKTMGPPSQTFLVQPKPMVPFRWVQVNILSNHGQINYTCVYKIRIHGHK